MATIVDQKITVQFQGDNDDVEIDMSDDGLDIYIEQASRSIFIPRAELEQFCAILRNWNAEHPRFAS